MVHFSHLISAQIESFFEGDLVRNPATKNSGKFVTLADFLELAKTKAVTGVLISIQVQTFFLHIFSCTISKHDQIKNSSYYNIRFLFFFPLRMPHTWLQKDSMLWLQSRLPLATPRWINNRHRRFSSSQMIARCS